MKYYILSLSVTFLAACSNSSSGGDGEKGNVNPQNAKIFSSTNICTTRIETALKSDPTAAPVIRINTVKTIENGTISEQGDVLTYDSNIYYMTDSGNYSKPDYERLTETFVSEEQIDNDTKLKVLNYVSYYFEDGSSVAETDKYTVERRTKALQNDVKLHNTRVTSSRGVKDTERIVTTTGDQYKYTITSKWTNFGDDPASDVKTLSKESKCDYVDSDNHVTLERQEVVSP